MAEATSDAQAKFPGVSFTDENVGCILFLKIPNLKVKKKFKVFGPLEPVNGTINVELEKESVCAVISVEDASGKSMVYEYKKNLPEDINKAKSSWEIIKAERVKLFLVKEKPGSWERHSKYLQTKD